MINTPQTIPAKQYLDNKGIEYLERHGELITKCLFNGCDDDSRANEAHLYIKAETGQYHCKKCSEAGNLITLAKHLGDGFKDVALNPHSTNYKPKQKNTAKQVKFDVALVEKYHQALPEPIRRYLNQRGITDHYINQFKLGYGQFYGKNWITIPIKNSNDEYVFLKLRKDPQDNTNPDKYKFYPAGNSATLYGLDLLGKDNPNAIICEGEFDCMVLWSNGIPAITSTAGAGTFKKEWLEQLKHLQEIYICFDKDQAGEKGSERLITLLKENLTTASIHKITLPEMTTKQDKDITDYFVKFKGNVDNLFDKYSQKINPTKLKKNNDNDDGDDEESNQPPHRKLIEFLLSLNIKLFLDQYNNPYIAINGDGTEILKLESKNFEIWVLGQIYKNKLNFSKETIKVSKEVLISMAREQNEQHLAVRVATDKENNIWYDLGEKAVKIDENGWQIADNPPILFKRFKHQTGQIEPQQGDSLSPLFDLINLKSESDKILLQVYLISCFIPNFPHPILVLFGQQGSAKSTLFRLLKKVIDPSSLTTLPPIKDSNQFVQAVSHHWVAFFDNLSGLSNVLSDHFCRACTGEGFSKRKLYSDDDDFIYNIKHIIGINGVSNVVSKSDLLDRSLLIELVRIKKENRKSEKEINQHFEKIKPQILGACFGILAKAIKIEPTINLTETPRMADFATWGYAIAEAMQIGGEIFLKAYQDNIDRQNQEAIDASPIGFVVLELLKECNGEIKFRPNEMLEALNTKAENLKIDYRRNRFWPKDARWLWRRLADISTNLEVQGVKINKGRGDDRYITIEDTNIVVDGQLIDTVPTTPSSPTS